MSDSSLWPTKTEIMNLGGNSPASFLKKQATFLSQIDPSLQGMVNECGPTSGKEALPSLPETFVPSLSLKWADTKVIGKHVAFRFSVGRVGRVYSAEILRIRYNADSFWPVEVWDSLNKKSFSLYSPDAYEACLREIFTSEECLKKLHYIIVGKFTV